MKCCTIVGARPQFIKTAALSRVLRQAHKDVLIHTGQHYDYNMSKTFFDELSIPTPDYNLGISGGSHGAMTGRMLEAVEDVLIKEKPELVIVYGDTNSTIAGALAAVKLHIPVCHVEAGCRMGTFINPEEVNRVLTDRISTLLMCTSKHDVENLRREGITNGVHNTGDVMYDALMYYSNTLPDSVAEPLFDLNGVRVSLPDKYYLLTCHREENTGSDIPLTEVLKAMNSLDAPTIYLVHPRNKESAQRIKTVNGFNNILLIQPVGYLSSLYMVKYAEKIVTDSGGLQREAFAFNRQCVVLLEQAIWPQIMQHSIALLCKPVTKDILACLSVVPDFTKKTNPFGDGHAAEKIVDIINTFKP